MEYKYIDKIIKKGLNSNISIIGNEVLYDLCKKYPNHTNSGEVNAKIWLIGRAYAAAIERRKKYLEDPNDDFYEKRVIPIIMKSDIDKMFTSIRGIKIITKENILQILSVHKFVQDLFFNISGLEKRSLSSKYLHFHFPDLFYIYDSRAKQALKRISKYSNKNYKDFIFNNNVDKEYSDFFFAAFDAQKEIEDEYGLISIRQFDTLLITLANDRLRGK